MFLIMSSPPLVEIANARLCRGQTVVFDDLDLKVDQGEHLAILGPNGAGKSTLIKALNRELYPAAREDTVFRILGRDSWNVWALRRQLGFVSAELQQRYRPGSSVRDVVLSGFLSSIGVHGVAAAGLTDADRQAADAALADMGLEHLAERPFGKLSTGQQRLTLLARALVHRPHTLILDEPTQGLDFGTSFEIMRRIRGLARAGVSLFLVTHHLDEIPPEIGRIVLIRGGRILADGTADEVLSDRTLSEAFATSIRVQKLDGRYFALPKEP